MAASRLYAAETLEKLVREIFQALAVQYVAQTEAGEIAPSALPVVALGTGATVWR